MYMNYVSHSLIVLETKFKWDKWKRLDGIKDTQCTCYKGLAETQSLFHVWIQQSFQVGHLQLPTSSWLPQTHHLLQQSIVWKIQPATRGWANYTERGWHCMYLNENSTKFSKGNSIWTISPLVSIVQCPVLKPPNQIQGKPLPRPWLCSSLLKPPRLTGQPCGCAPFQDCHPVQHLPHTIGHQARTSALSNGPF